MFKVGMQWGMWRLEDSYPPNPLSSISQSLDILLGYRSYYAYASGLPDKNQRDWLSDFPNEMSKINLWVFIFVCMWWEGAKWEWCGVESAIPTCGHVSHVSPWVTTSPLPSTHVGVRDMWETTSIYGSQWQMGVSTPYGQNLEIPAILAPSVITLKVGLGDILLIY